MNVSFIDDEKLISCGQQIRFTISYNNQNWIIYMKLIGIDIPKGPDPHNNNPNLSREIIAMSETIVQNHKLKTDKTCVFLCFIDPCGMERSAERG